MPAIITNQGAELIAKQQAKGAPLVIKNFVFAFIEGLDTTQAPSETESLPSADKIKYSPAITKAGYVNPAQVVYSVIVGSDIGDWSYNWLGLQSEDGTLFAVAYLPTQQKIKNNPPQMGNTITRNFLISFDGAQSITEINIPAEAWQFDITDKLDDMDERSRRGLRSVYGRSTFFYDGFKIIKNGALVQLSPGVAFVEGILINQSDTLTLTPEAGKAIYLDVFLQKQDNIKKAMVNMAYGDNLADYTDSAGTVHYLINIADSRQTDTRTRVLNAHSIINAISNDPNGDPLDIASIAALQKLKDDLIVNTNDLIGNVSLTKEMRGIINIDATKSDTVVTLPQATADNKGVEYTIRRTDMSDFMLQVKAATNDKILFHLNLSPTGFGHFELIGLGDYWTIYCDGAGHWFVTGRYDSAPMGIPQPLMSLAFPVGGYFPAYRTAFDMSRYPWLVLFAEQGATITQADADKPENAGKWVIDTAKNQLLSPTLGGEFIRALDVGRSIDPERTPGSWQKASLAFVDTGSAGAWSSYDTTRTDSIDTALKKAGLESFNTSDYPGVRMAGAGAPTVIDLPGTGLDFAYAGAVRPRNIAYPFIFKAI